jgi:hypothetical protein
MAKAKAARIQRIRFLTSVDEPVICPKVIILLSLIFLIAGYSIEGLYQTGSYHEALAHSAQRVCMPRLICAASPEMTCAGAGEWDPA